MKYTGRHYEHAEPMQEYGAYKEDKQNSVLLQVAKVVRDIKHSSLKAEDKEELKRLALRTISDDLR